MPSSRRTLIAAGLVAAGTLAIGAPALAQGRRKLRFGVGPLLPTAADTRKAYTPFFAHLAEQLGADFELVATTDWAGMAVAMGAGQLDLAWMGPWGYIIANNSTGCTALATVKYDEKPVYYAVIIGKPELKVNKFPDDTRGLTMSFADVGSTSGWLIPTWYAKEVWKIDPKSYWKYSEGATHAANEMSVQAGQSDMATDFDRNRNSMIESGRVKANSNKVLWTSAPLPNDAIVVPKGTPAALIEQVQKILTSITVEQAKTLLPPHYTGFVKSDHSAYESIEKAGIAVGKIKPKA
jgi:phosphonate transport system substrate-binding protein